MALKYREYSDHPGMFEAWMVADSPQARPDRIADLVRRERADGRI
jgi:hypothetical protein